MEKNSLFSSTSITKDGEKEGLGEIGHFDYWALEKNQTLNGACLVLFSLASEAASKRMQGCLTPACQKPGTSNGKDQINVAWIN